MFHLLALFACTQETPTPQKPVEVPVQREPTKQRSHNPNQLPPGKPFQPSDKPQAPGQPFQGPNKPPGQPFQDPNQPPPSDPRNSKQEPITPAKSIEKDSWIVYLREGLPMKVNDFPRVNPRMFDLGTLSGTPPDDMEIRACGDVVAFSSADKLFGEEIVGKDSIHIREIEYRIWWHSGAGRGMFSLYVPGIPEGIAGHRVAVCDLPAEHPDREGGFTFTRARVPVNRTLTAKQLQGMYLTLDVANAFVSIGTCPGRTSSLIFNPPPLDKTRKLDSDKDGVPDAVEQQGITDPYRADKDAKPCLKHPEETAVHADGAQPALPSNPSPWPVITQKTDLSKQVVKITGTTRLTFPLTLHDSTVILAADDTGMPPSLIIEEGGSIDADRAVFAAQDPAMGFSLIAQPGSIILMKNSKFLHPGAIILEETRANSEGVVIKSDKAIISNNQFIHGLKALTLEGNQASVTKNVFRGNGTAITLVGKGNQVKGNRSEHDGIFVLLDGPSQDTWIKNNIIEDTIDRAIMLQIEATSNTIVGNTIRNARMGIHFAGAKGNTISNNNIDSCRDGLDPGPDNREATLAANNISGNKLTSKKSPHCGGRLSR